MKKQRVGIITWHYYSNFGSALQAYALQKALQNYCSKVEILNYRNPKFGKPNAIKDNLRIALSNIVTAFGIHTQKFKSPFVSFQQKHLNQTKAVQSDRELKKLCQKTDIVVCGSDQIWAPNVFNPIYMLNFVPEDKKKISYAASIGLNQIPSNLTIEYSSLLSKFSAISVRERAGAELLIEQCNIDANVVLDPTLLIDASEWSKLEKKPQNASGDKFVFCYFLNKDHCYKNCVVDFVNKNGYKIIGVSSKNDDANWMDIQHIGPQEFLWFVHNAECVFTDSYHGTIFSLLYHKSFVTFERFKSADIICQNSRIYQLNDYFNISQNIIIADENTEIVLNNIDYDTFETQLLNLRSISLDFLKSSLEA
ncbi:MAG: polysaccharide pyruvyl transferase family protein [Clostridia bacterium]|nr:polysaccharide pyruvyl transferase family protein [Clostridia bacterium]